MTEPGPSSTDPHDHSVIGTLQSLIVAFVLAMTFRGFVAEGFVIPTGSMAPTLFGRHVPLHSEETGWDFAVGIDQGSVNKLSINVQRIADPMLGSMYVGTGSGHSHARPRMGDRILVLKSLYPFFRPSRFDVVVFKNPTNPNGPDGNYIKRLIGLPGESIWLVDGDVFVGTAAQADDYDAYRVARKPEHVQRAVWQPVYRSDFFPIDVEGWDQRYLGAPWQGEGWAIRDRSGAARGSFRCQRAEASTLTWMNTRLPLDDWAPYNQLTDLRRRVDRYHVNDVRVAAAVTPDNDGLGMTLRLSAREHDYEFIIEGGTAQVRMRSAGDTRADWQSAPAAAIDPLPAGRPTNVEFWHVDQSMAIYINGRRVTELLYDWRPKRRLIGATGTRGPIEVMASRQPTQPSMLNWTFHGSPVTLDRVEVDRDLYYRTARLDTSALRNPTGEAFEAIVAPGQPAFGTHPDNLAILGPDHFFMLGDNSAASSDSRLWGNPHPLVAVQLDASPFVVHRKLLLGKAWLVYFPAPHALSEGGKSIIPNFGKLRFIR